MDPRARPKTERGAGKLASCSRGLSATSLLSQNLFPIEFFQICLSDMKIWECGERFGRPGISISLYAAPSAKTGTLLLAVAFNALDQLPDDPRSMALLRRVHSGAYDRLAGNAPESVERGKGKPPPLTPSIFRCGWITARNRRRSHFHDELYRVTLGGFSRPMVLSQWHPNRPTEQDQYVQTAILECDLALNGVFQLIA